VSEAPPRTAFTAAERRLIDRLRTPTQVQRFLNALPYNTEPPPGRAHPGLHGRRPVFRSLRHLALSYFEPYVDATGCVRAYGSVDLRALGDYDWRLSANNIWRVERLLFEIPHHPIRYSQARVDRLRRRYNAYRAAHDGRKPVYYDRTTWTDIPEHFTE
jgi:hypothetical protein